LVIAYIRPKDAVVYTVLIQSDVLNATRLFSTRDTSTADKPGPVSLPISGQTDHDTTTSVAMTSHRRGENAAVSHLTCCQVTSGTFFGFITIGSTRRPVKRAEDIDYQLLGKDATGKQTILAQGRMSIQVGKLGEGLSGSWVIVAVGLLATSLQIADTVRQFLDN
jgi:hypothetical protein